MKGKVRRGYLFLGAFVLSHMAVETTIELDYGSEAEAVAVLGAISPDNAPYAEAERSGTMITIRARSSTAGQMLHTMEDLLACVKVAEDTFRAAQ